ncbi:MAG TPA: hypothetical protein P5123_05765 [Spirochaetota bacterium]|nr:hypothetical protein [Spirochaetota bacterium]
MNIHKEIAASTVDSHSSLLRYFSLKFFLYTEFISYFIIVPILFINIILSLELDFEQLKMMFYITLVVVAISFSSTLINNHIVLAPVTKYFKALINKQNISEEMYLEAQHRFFNLPLYHSIGSFFRWMIGLSLQFAPFLSLYNFTSIQKTNTWILVAIMAPFGSIFYFLFFDDRDSYTKSS